MIREDDPLARARRALSERDWPAAYDALHEADGSALTGSDFEGLADAAWWTSRWSESIDARHRAYDAYAAAGDDAVAAAVAARIAIEHFVREEAAIGSGYLARARRHAEHVPEGIEHGFLMMVEANVAHFSGDTDTAIALARDAAAIGQRYGAADLVAMALHAEGLTLLDAGEIPQGLARMDEAMIDVLSGRLDPYFTGIIYCSLIAACLELNDLRRAGEWSDAAQTWCDTLPPGSPFPGMCRVNRAEVARLRGAWDQAEAEATLASRELESVEPSLAGMALVQVGEIARRRGDAPAAETAFSRARALGADPNPGFALLRLAQGKRDAARTSLEATLRSEHQIARRARLLWAQVELALASDAAEEATNACAELRSMADAAATPGFDALATTAEGTCRLAAGNALEAAERFRAAVTLWRSLKLPWEEAGTVVLLGRALAAIGDDAGAQATYRSALSVFERLGANADAEEVRRLLGAPRSLPRGLTAREAEVLRLVAAGKTNRDIAVELVISEHTVSRHLQNLFAKAGVSSRAAATAFAYEHGLA